MHHWHVSENLEQASVATALHLASAIEQVLNRKEICRIILPGGNTPAKCFQLLAQNSLPWENIYWYPGDERCYPVGHADRNDLMLQKNLWSLLPEGAVTEENVYAIPAELGAEQGARKYREVVMKVTCFDIALLGIGEDGHTASLFPGNAALKDKHCVVAVHDSPKPPAERVSFGINVLRDTELKIVLASGVAKSEVISRIKKGDKLPINSIGDIYWYVDQQAIGS